MKFIQVVEQSGDIEEARAEIEGYFESTGDDSKVKKLTLCTDRDAPGKICLLYTSPSPRDRQKSRMPSSA